jgi:hypothetical protein
MSFVVTTVGTAHHAFSLYPPYRRPWALNGIAPRLIESHYEHNYGAAVTRRRMIAERYAKGETMAALASEFGVGEATVWRVLRGDPAA